MPAAGKVVDLWKESFVIMFESSVYANRRRTLLERMLGASGIAVFVGNADAAMNYRGNDYKFRQDSSFLYYWGIDEPYFAAVLDLESGEECLYGNDVDIDDIIWMGPQPSVASKGALIGCARTAALAEFDKFLGRFLSDMREDDILMITADHGCDPSTPSTDHSREYTPMLILGDGLRAGVNMGVRSSFADIGATVLDIFAIEQEKIDGVSFLTLLK